MAHYNIDGPYEYVREGVRERANDLAKKGPGYEGVVRVNLGILREHTTASEERDVPCVACAELWPCSQIRSALA